MPEKNVAEIKSDLFVDYDNLCNQKKGRDKLALEIIEKKLLLPQSLLI